MSRQIDMRGSSPGLGPLQHDDHGRPLCRWCGEAVQPPRRSWCSQQCVDEYKEIAELFSSAGRRAAVFERDHGICAQCGLDCVWLKQRMLRGWRLLCWRKRRPFHYPSHRDTTVVIRRWLERRLGRKVGALSVHRTWWEADHITPQVEGGTHELTNLRTLCLWCHRGETSSLARRRANARSPQESLPL